MTEFLDVSSQRYVNALRFAHKALKRDFIKMKTAISSSAAIERVFSMEETFWGPKDRGYMIPFYTYFEMLLCLKANK